MSNEYNYDADAQFYPYFVLIVSGLVTIPLTYSLLRAPSDASTQAKAGHIDSSFKPEDADIIDSQRAKEKRKELRLKRMLTAATGWLVIAYMIYLIIVTARTAEKIWDPFSILDISMSATEKQINSRYRKLSTTMHPDKRRPNPVLNETLETINDDWVEIVKAYKALTDEEIRNNWVQYGNPDGKQSTSFGIALPKILVADGNGKYVLAFYGIILGIGLPFLVGRWWYGMQSKTRERILVTTAGNMFREFDEKMDTADVASTVSSAVEFKEILSGTRADTGLGKVEKQLANSEHAGVIMLPKDQKALREQEDPARRKTLALLWAYLTRTDLEDKTLESEKYELPPTALKMTEAFIPICLAHGFTKPVMSSYELCQSLIQAVPPTSVGRAPLLQLPHFTPKIVREIENSANDRREHMTIQSFMALPAEQRQALAQAAGLDNARLKVAEGVARQLPLLKVEKAWFKVQGEKHLLPSSLVQYVVKARFIPPGTPASSIPALTEKDLEDIDPAEGDIAAQKIEPEQHHIPLAHGPFFAGDRSPKYHIFLADNRQGKIAVPPFTFHAFDKKPFDNDGKPTFNVVTLKMQFAAPPQAGEYKFQMQLVCDSYIGFDYKHEATMIIQEPSAAQQEEDEEEDEISEPDEDTIAGQMAALKGKATSDPSKPKGGRNARLKAKLAAQDEESDYESGTDDEDQDDESETDTDTDSEAESEKNKKKGWW